MNVNDFDDEMKEAICRSIHRAVVDCMPEEHEILAAIADGVVEAMPIRSDIVQAVQDGVGGPLAKAGEG